MKNEGILSVVSGSSRNGKTVYVKRMLEKFKQALVWDVDGEYTDGFIKVSEINDLLNLLKRRKHENIKIAFNPKNLGVFDMFCMIAIAWGTDTGELAVVVEETADVTTPSKAPANFRVLIGRGMKRGISLFCVTQRPSESDKTSLGNAKKIVTFYMTRAQDREYMAREMGCDAGDIEGLEKLHYLEKDVDARKILAGEVVF